jgi:hypothetical protein
MFLLRRGDEGGRRLSTGWIEITESLLRGDGAKHSSMPMLVAAFFEPGLRMRV